MHFQKIYTSEHAHRWVQRRTMNINDVYSEQTHLRMRPGRDGDLRQSSAKGASGGGGKAGSGGGLVLHPRRLICRGAPLLWHEGVPLPRGCPTAGRCPTPACSVLIVIRRSATRLPNSVPGITLAANVQRATSARMLGAALNPEHDSGEESKSSNEHN